MNLDLSQCHVGTPGGPSGGKDLAGGSSGRERDTRSVPTEAQTGDGKEKGWRCESPENRGSGRFRVQERKRNGGRSSPPARLVTDLHLLSSSRGPPGTSPPTPDPSSSSLFSLFLPSRHGPALQFWSLRRDLRENPLGRVLGHSGDSDPHTLSEKEGPRRHRRRNRHAEEETLLNVDREPPRREGHQSDCKRTSEGVGPRTPFPESGEGRWTPGSDRGPPPDFIGSPQSSETPREPTSVEARPHSTQPCLTRRGGRGVGTPTF